MSGTTLYGTAFGVYRAQSGTVYNALASGEIDSVAPNDVLDLLGEGCTVFAGVGTVGVAATHVSAQEYGDSKHHQTVLTFLAGAVLPAIAGGASLGVGVLLYTLPVGAQLIRAARMNVAITQSQGHINTDTPTVGLGSVIASGAIAVLSGTATFQNIGVGKAAADCNGTPTVQSAKPTASPFELVTEAGGVKAIYFNAAFAWAASGDAAAALSGNVALDWTTLA